MAAELGLGLALMFRRTRPAALVAGVIFHVANCVVLAIPEFLLSVTAYAVFIETSTLQRWGAWITSAVTNRRPASAS